MAVAEPDFGKLSESRIEAFFTTDYILQMTLQ